MTRRQLQTTARADTRPVALQTWLAGFRVARHARPDVASYCSAPGELESRAGCSWHLAADGLAGYGLTADGELIGLWSVARGRGAALVTDAVARGARKLDCFDGYLVQLYSRHGFREVGREPNWTPGGPDVVFMELAS